MTLTLDRRTRKINTGKREADLPVDALGRERARFTLDRRSIERRGDGDPIGFKGHALLFNKRTWIGPKRWGFWEQIAPGACTKTIGEADVRFLINHDPNLLLARNKAGTLTLGEDAQGLAVDSDMAPVSYAQDLAVLLDRGDISQMSFAFETIQEKWEELDDGNELRTLLEIKLWDVSVVTYPAYEDTDAGLRSFAFEQTARALGLDDEARSKLLEAVAAGDSLTNLLPAPPPAGQRSEPAETTRDPGQPAETTGDPTDGIRRRFRDRAALEVERIKPGDHTCT